MIVNRGGDSKIRALHAMNESMKKFQKASPDIANVIPQYKIGNDFIDTSIKIKRWKHNLVEKIANGFENLMTKIKNR